MPVQPIMYNVLWSPEQTDSQRNAGGEQPDDNNRGDDNQASSGTPVPDIDNNEDEIPF